MWRPLEYLGNLQSDTESESKDNACGGDDHKGPDDPAELKCSNSPVSAKFEGNALLVKIPPSADEVTLKIDVLVGGKKFELEDLRHGGLPVPKKPLDSWDLSDVSQSSIMHTPNSSKKKVPPAPRYNIACCSHNNLLYLITCSIHAQYLT